MVNERLGEAVVDVVADTGRFDRDFDLAMQRAARRASKLFGQELASRGRASGIAYAKAFEREVGRRLGRNVENQVASGAGGGGGGMGKAGERAGGNFGKGFGRGFSKVVKSGLFGPRGPVAGVLPRAVAGIGILGIAPAALASLATGLGAAATAAGALVTALAPAAGILGALPATVAGFAGAIGTLKVATIGMEDAFKNVFADSEKFNESIKNLTPSARSFVREIRGMKPALDGMRRATQEALFKPMVGQLEKLSDVVSGPLQKGMSTLAADFGNVAKEGLNFAGSKKATDAITALFEGLSGFTKGAGKGVEAALGGIADAIKAIAPLAKEAGEAVGSWLKEWGTRLSEEANTNVLERRVRAAVDVFGELKDIIGNIVGAGGGIATALNNAFGGDLLGKVKQVTAEFSKWTQSSGGQSTLTRLFDSLRRAGLSLAPVFAELGKQASLLVQSLPSISEEASGGLAGIIRGLGDGLRNLANGAASFTAAVGNNLGLLLTSIGVGLGDLVDGAGPGFRSALAKLASAVNRVDWTVVGSVLGTLFDALASALEKIAPLVDLVFQAVNKLLGLYSDVNKATGGGAGDVLGTGAAAGAALYAVNKIKKMFTGTGLLGGGKEAEKAGKDSAKKFGRGFLDNLKKAGKAAGKGGLIGFGLSSVFGAEFDKINKQQKDWAKETFSGAGGWSSTMKKLLKEAPYWDEKDLRNATAAFDLSKKEVAALRAEMEKKPKGRGLLAVGDELRKQWNSMKVQLPLAAGNAATAAQKTATRASVAIAAATAQGAVNQAKKQFDKIPPLMADPVQQGMVAARAKAAAGGAALAAQMSVMNVQMATNMRPVPGTISDPVQLGFTLAQTQAAVGAARTAAATAALAVQIRLAMSGVPSAIADPIRRGFADAVEAARSGVSRVLAMIALIRARAAAAAAAASIRFANGGIVNKATPAIVGEAGREVIIPLTRPRRAEELARQSGLLKLLAQRGAVNASEKSRRGRERPGKQTTVNAPITVTTAARDPSIVAHKVISRLGRAIPTGAW